MVEDWPVTTNASTAATPVANLATVIVDALEMVREDTKLSTACAVTLNVPSLAGVQAKL